MGTLLFTETNNSTNEHNEVESEKFHLNYNFGAQKSSEETKSEVRLRHKRQQKCKCRTTSFIISGLICIALGFLSTRFTFTDIILNEIMKMEPWFPVYNIWINQEPEVRLNVYIFTVENANEFLSGVDAKIRIKEFGPIVYRDDLKHGDVVRHSNSTISYSTYRRSEYLPHANRAGILNETIIVPNLPILTAATFANKYNYLIQYGYNFLHKKYNNGLFINITVYDYLWNYRSQLIEKLEELVPSMVSTTNAGLLYSLYSRSADRFNVKIGPKYKYSEFFQINTFNGAPHALGYDAKSGYRYSLVANSSEGSLYRQRITKDDVLSYWAVCRSIDLHFTEEMQTDGILSYKFVSRPDVHDRKLNNTTDKACGELQNGVTDISKCYAGPPFALSLPHFYGRSKGFTEKIEGLCENGENHTTFVIMQPKLGIPMAQHVRLQMNLVLPKFSFLFEKDYQLFSDMILPLCWIEFVQKELTPRFLFLVDFFVNVLPIVELTLTCTLFLVGLALISGTCIKFLSSKWTHLNESKQINFQFVQRMQARI